MSSLFQQFPMELSICCMCGANQASPFSVTSQDTWVPYRIAYHKDKKRFVCRDCIKVYKPSLVLALESKDKQTLKSISCHDSNGNLLPHTRHIQLQLLPQWYPSEYLADEKIKARLISLIQLSDCVCMKLIPISPEQFFIREHLKMFGYIYTSYKHLSIDRMLQIPCTLLFKTYWTERDRKVALFSIERD